MVTDIADTAINQNILFIPAHYSPWAGVTFCTYLHPPLLPEEGILSAQ
jgi:hypothetical protein